MINTGEIIKNSQINLDNSNKFMYYYIEKLKICKG